MSGININDISVCLSGSFPSGCETGKCVDQNDSQKVLWELFVVTPVSVEVLKGNDYQVGDEIKDFTSIRGGSLMYQDELMSLNASFEPNSISIV